MKQENTKRNTRDVNAAQRVQLALSLRAQRLPWDDVAAQAGFASRGAAHNAVQRELARCISSKVEEMRNEELLMLDTLQAEIWGLAMDKENKGRLFAVDRILAISERRCKLMGLDVPVSGANIAAAQVVVRELPPGYFGSEEIKG